MLCCFFFFFKQKTAYELRISDCSSDVCSSDLNVDDVAPKWLLSPPTGLAGVTEIAIEGFAKHLHTARYSLAGTADYERYIGILDAEYGKSERRPNGDCTYRIWESGQMVVRGEH